jgi:uncharacterized membrane protein SirB2
MMFFTVRATPETTTASFSVDLMVMVAIYVYLEITTLDVARRQVSSSQRPVFIVPSWGTEGQPGQIPRTISRR